MLYNHFVSAIPARIITLQAAQQLEPEALEYPNSAGMYFSLSDLIVINDIKIAMQRLGTSKDCNISLEETLLHELVHWTGHHSRLNRFNTETIMNLGYLHTEEVIAQLGMYKLSLHMVDLDHATLKKQADLYIAKLCFADMAKAEIESDRAVNYLLAIAKSNLDYQTAA